MIFWPDVLFNICTLITFEIYPNIKIFANVSSTFCKLYLYRLKFFAKVAKFRPIWSHCWWPWWRGQKIDNFLIGLMLISTSAPGTKKPNSWKIWEFRKNKKDLKWMLMPCQSLHDSRVNFRHLGKNSSATFRGLFTLYLAKIGNLFWKKKILGKLKWLQMMKYRTINPGNTVAKTHWSYLCLNVFKQTFVNTSLN